VRITLWITTAIHLETPLIQGEPQCISKLGSALEAGRRIRLTQIK
jgi:hypothetical protein